MSQLSHSGLGAGARQAEAWDDARCASKVDTTSVTKINGVTGYGFGHGKQRHWVCVAMSRVSDVAAQDSVPAQGRPRPGATQGIRQR